MPAFAGITGFVAPGIDCDALGGCGGGIKGCGGGNGGATDGARDRGGIGGGTVFARIATGVGIDDGVWISS